MVQLPERTNTVDWQPSIWKRIPSCDSRWDLTVAFAGVEWIVVAAVGIAGCATVFELPQSF